MSKPILHPIIKTQARGRGSLENPSGRFESYQKEIADTPLEEYELEDIPALKTQIFKDTSKTIISTNDSPDIGMEATLNPYRGCEHGCIYCFARPTHEYLGLSVGLDFETKIFIKQDAAVLLREKFLSRKWQPKIVTLSGVTDCYQPLERDLKITRSCLEVLLEFRNPVAIITKNSLVTRDIDILKELASFNAVVINMSVTTLDRMLARNMEPRTSTPALRLKAIEKLSNAGIPVNVMVGPVIPGLTDHEIPEILKAASSAGAKTANYTMLRLPYGVKDIFQTWLHEHYPDRAERILNRVRDVREGKLYNAEFGTRMTGTGIYAEQISQMFSLYRKKYNLGRRIELSTSSFRKIEAQGDLFA